MTEALVLDVGHAGCVLVRTPNRTVMVDAGKTYVCEVLDALGIQHIDDLILTHRHRDHTSGAWTLLTEPRFSIGRLYVNPHPNGADARAMTRAANAAWESHSTEMRAINVTTTETLSDADLSVEVLWPNIEYAKDGIGGRVGDELIGAHQLAVVVRLSDWNGRSLLLCADAPHNVLDALVDDAPEKMSADALVYPHHGGRAVDGGSDALEEAFATRLTTAVAPSVVIFSNGRTRFDNPRKSVIAGVRASGAQARIACTQINARCGGPLMGIARPIPGEGTEGGHACAGSVVLNLDPSSPLDPRQAEHARLIAELASAQCIDPPVGA